MKHEQEPRPDQPAGKTYRGFSDSPDTAGPRAIFVEQPNGERHPLPVSGHHTEHDRNWGYSGAGPRRLAQDILADHLGAVPSRPVIVEYRDHGPAHWEQGRPWQTTSAEIDVFLAADHIQAKLEEQRQDERLQQAIEDLERLEQDEDMYS